MKIWVVAVALALFSCVAGASAQNQIDGTASQAQRLRQQRLDDSIQPGRSRDVERLQYDQRRRDLQRLERRLRQSDPAQRSKPVNSGNSRNSVVRTQ